MTAQQRFEQIYAEHVTAVHRYALRRMARGEADDVVAEVFLIVWRRLDEVPAQPRGWLLGVARRVASNARRGEQRRTALHERLTAERQPHDEEPAEDSRLAQALLELPETYREALTLVAWDGLSYREAAQALGVRESTFGVRLLRARRRLAQALARSPQASTSNTTTPLEAR
ncbi:MAG TPA: RNA polymerase sigma factor [Solirubrobacteraceae bacterium]